MDISGSMVNDFSFVKDIITQISEYVDYVITFTDEADLYKIEEFLHFEYGYGKSTYMNNGFMQMDKLIKKFEQRRHTTPGAIKVITLTDGYLDDAAIVCERHKKISCNSRIEMFTVRVYNSQYNSPDTIGQMAASMVGVLKDIVLYNPRNISIPTGLKTVTAGELKDILTSFLNTEIPNITTNEINVLNEVKRGEFKNWNSRYLQNAYFLAVIKSLITCWTASKLYKQETLERLSNIIHELEYGSVRDILIKAFVFASDSADQNSLQLI
ncbi:MAG: hypothetical protein EHM79_20140, partial [Geobacter sp.]